MNLRIPQTQIDENLTLGILGVEHRKGDTRVQFIMRSKYSVIFATGFNAEEFGKQLNAVEVSNCSSATDAPITCTVLFVVKVSGELRHPQGLLKALGRRIRKLQQLELREQFENCSPCDTEVHY